MIDASSPLEGKKLSYITFCAPKVTYARHLPANRNLIVSFLLRDRAGILASFWLCPLTIVIKYPMLLKRFGPPSVPNCHRVRSGMSMHWWRAKVTARRRSDDECVGPLLPPFLAGNSVSNIHQNTCAFISGRANAVSFGHVTWDKAFSVCQKGHCWKTSEVVLQGSDMWRTCSTCQTRTGRTVERFEAGTFAASYIEERAAINAVHQMPVPLQSVNRINLNLL
jgi:hypothetical protein